MHKTGRAILALFTAIELTILLMAFAKPAYGYVDPGSGLLAIQVGGSMLAGALFMIRSKIRKLFRIRSADTKPESEQKLPSQPGE